MHLLIYIKINTLSVQELFSPMCQVKMFQGKANHNILKTIRTDLRQSKMYHTMKIIIQSTIIKHNSGISFLPTIVFVSFSYSNKTTIQSAMRKKTQTPGFCLFWRLSRHWSLPRLLVETMCSGNYHIWSCDHILILIFIYHIIHISNFCREIINSLVFDILGQALHTFVDHDVYQMSSLSIILSVCPFR